MTAQKHNNISNNYNQREHNNIYFKCISIYNKDMNLRIQNEDIILFQNNYNEQYEYENNIKAQMNAQKQYTISITYNKTNYNNICIKNISIYNNDMIHWTNIEDIIMWQKCFYYLSNKLKYIKINSQNQSRGRILTILSLTEPIFYKVKSRQIFKYHLLSAKEKKKSKIQTSCNMSNNTLHLKTNKKSRYKKKKCSNIYIYFKKSLSLQTYKKLINKEIYSGRTLRI